ncbi:MAG TPA: hypothetical protein VEX68_29545 [Bryobacteraceae bacterium]|nr:hypothetical protein [Bryobacteraceae bacterium]
MMSVLPLFALFFAAAPNPTAIDKFFARMYNFDFVGAHSIVDAHLRAKPADGFGHAVRASAFLFQELHRLRILESEFFAEDKRFIAKKKLKPDPQTRDVFEASLQTADREAQRVIASNPKDAEALFTMSLVASLRADYMALIDKRQLQSLTYIKESQSWSLRLLQSHPNFADAELTGGACEYLLGSMPFFVRWFVRVDGVEGQKASAAPKLERVAASGRYLGPFARILLAIVHLREKQPARSLAILNQLSREYPQNPLFRSEAKKVAALIEGN